MTKYLSSDFSDVNEPNDTLLYTDFYTFDKARKYIAHADGDRFALASENSSEISMYHKTSFNHHTDFFDYPKLSGNIEYITDDGKGTFAAIHYNYVDNIKQNYLVIYDAINNKLGSFKQEDFNVKNMVFSNDKLLLISTDAQAMVLDYSGNVLESFDLTERIKEVAGYDEDMYFYLYLKYIAVPGKKIVLGTDEGLFTVDISGENAVVETVLKGNSLDDYCITNGFASCIVDNYKENSEEIVCFIDGDNEVSYVSENGESVKFVKDTIISPINTDIGNKIAFINKEGYIGIYGYGDNTVKKIAFQSETTNPIQIKFTPDGQSLIAMCSNGKFIKYDVTTGEIIAEYDAEFAVDKYTIYEFMDDCSLYIRKYRDASSITILDIGQMEEIADIDNFQYYLKSEQKLICRKYDGEYYTMGYYDYKTTEQLIDFAKNFLENK